MKKSWLNSYPKEVTETITDHQYSSLADMLEHAVARYADQPAFINMGEVMTFRKLEERSRAFAAYLQNDLTLKKGDRVALMMPNLLQYPIALFGVLRAGMLVVNVNPMYTPRELEHQLNDSGAVAIVVVSNFAHTLEQIVYNTQVKHVILTRMGDQLSRPKATVVDFIVKYIKRLVPKYNLPNAVSFRRVLRSGYRMQYVKPRISGDDIAFLQYTGGTTGVSKGAMLTHHNLLANLAQTRAAYGPVLQFGQEMIVTALPLYHIFALMVNCLLFIDIGGMNLLITNPRDIPETVKELSRYPISAITGVNTLFNAWLNNAHFVKLDFSNLRLSVGGGMPIQKAVANKWQAITGRHLLEGYGLTECSPLVCGNPYTLSEYNGSIGLPVPSTDVRFVDERGQDVPVGEKGEMWVKGPQIMKGYWNDQKATNEVFHNDWLATGDIGFIDEQGFIKLVDRKKDVIIVSGFNVFPAEVEDVVASHPSVIECAAIGIPHELTGEAVKVFVVSKNPDLTLNDLTIHCRQSLTAYKVPKLFELRDELPKSNVGKILRRELRNEERAKKTTPETE